MNINTHFPSYLLPVETAKSADQNQAFNNNDTEVQAPSGTRKKRGVADPRKLWPQHSTVSISLIGMTDEQKALTKQNILKWQPHINLKLEFIDTDEGDIRIMPYIHNRGGGESSVGKDSQHGREFGPSMYIGFTNDPQETGRIIQHEFGHALGLKHEHQHPGNRLKYDYEAVVGLLGENRATTEFFTRHNPDTTTQTPYDHQSIMHYHLPAEYMADGYTNAQNYELSAGDKYIARKLYPPKRVHGSSWGVALVRNRITGGLTAFEFGLGARGFLQTESTPPE